MEAAGMLKQNEFEGNQVEREPLTINAKRERKKDYPKKSYLEVNWSPSLP